MNIEEYILKLLPIDQADKTKTIIGLSGWHTNRLTWNEDRDYWWDGTFGYSPTHFIYEDDI